MMKRGVTSRRSFLVGGATALGAFTLPKPGSAAPEPAQAAPLKLGFDNFSVRALKWKAPRLIEHAVSLGCDVLLISDLDAFESHDPAALRDLGRQARDQGVELQVGTLSVCPTSTRFSDRWGTAEEHLRLLVRVAREIGSPVARCVLGFAEDRRTPGGIQARIADTVKVLRAVRSEALDAGVKFAVENHAGDMTARELAALIESAGTDLVGATIDSGNATWTLESPQRNFDLLHPHILTSGIRDSMVWQTPEGARVQWTALGDGLVDWKKYFADWQQKAPERPVILEIISGFSRPFDFLKEDFWQGYEDVRAEDFATFLELARRGSELPPFKSTESLTEADYQLGELQKSVQFCRELGLGRRT